MARVSSGPYPVHFVQGIQLIEFHPEVGVAHRLMLSPPVPLLPFENPLRDAVEYILRVGCDLHLTRFSQRQEALNRRHQFHPVVGGARIESEELLLCSAEPRHACPPPWAGI